MELGILFGVVVLILLGSLMVVMLALGHVQNSAEGASAEAVVPEAFLPFVALQFPPFSANIFECSQESLLNPS